MSPRSQRELRALTIEANPLEHPAGSALVRWGRTIVLCAASVEERLPKWRSEEEGGWVTAEYSMLPAATHTRGRRERGSAPSRSLEIGRLVGRSLRATVDFVALGPRTVRVDCDVLQADGGTRCAAVTGGAVALELALRSLASSEDGPAPNALRSRAAAVSVGLVDDELVVDLNYDLDHRAQVDLNVVMSSDGRLVEVQGTAEGRPFSASELAEMTGAALDVLPALLQAQEQALRAESPR